MQDFLSSVMFVIPGLMGYYMFQLLGMGPSQKHNVFEMLSLSTLMWFPVSILSLAIYNCIRKLDFIDGAQIKHLQEFTIEMNGTKFLIFYLLCSLISSFVIALILVPLIRLFLIKIINPIRKGIFKIAPFSKYTTVWEEIFHEGKPRVVEISKVDKQEKETKFVGSIRKASRAMELDRNIVLSDVEYFTKLVEQHKPAIDKVFFDTKAGMLVKLFNQKQVEEMQKPGFKKFTSS